MKIIDLLNKIAKGDRFENCKMKFKEIEPEEVNEYVIYDRLYEEYLTLNSEVEIIEEDKDIKLLRDDYIEEFENMSGERQQYVIKTLMEIALKKM